MTAGKRTSVYLAADVHDAVKASPHSAGEIMRAGLVALGELDAPLTRADLRAELAPLLAAIKANGSAVERARARTAGPTAAALAKDRAEDQREIPSLVAASSKASGKPARPGERPATCDHAFPVARNVAGQWVCKECG